MESFTASAIIGIVSYFMLQLTDPYFSQETVIGVFGHGFVSGITGIVIGITFLCMVNNKEISVFVILAKKKLWKFRAINAGDSQL